MLKTLKLENFTVFPKAELEFSPGLNVIVGENGTGKSHLLKLVYAVLRSLRGLDKAPAKEAYGRDLAKHLLDIFCPDSLGRLSTRTQGHSKTVVKCKYQKTGVIAYEFSTRSSDLVNINELVFTQLPSKALFIPPKEILSVFRGFQHALENRELEFDETYLDLCRALNGAPLKGPRLKAIAAHLNTLEEHMGGYISQENQRFYFHSTNNKGKFEAHLMAEGNRKLGMLAYLLKIGELTQNSSLFWDEPEANLNPKLQAKLAEILVELSNVMQITIATHSLFLLREIEILQEQKKIDVPPKFFGLHFNAEGGVEVTEGISSNDIGDIAALDENLMQSERYMELAYQE